MTTRNLPYSTATLLARALLVGNVVSLSPRPAPKTACTLGMAPPWARAIRSNWSFPRRWKSPRTTWPGKSTPLCAKSTARCRPICPTRKSHVLTGPWQTGGLTYPQKRPRWSPRPFGSAGNLERYDITIGPLVQLWHFGHQVKKDPSPPTPPSAEAIEVARQYVGYQRLQVRATARTAQEHGTGNRPLLHCQGIRGRSGRPASGRPKTA